MAKAKSLKFKSVTKHGKLTFIPGAAYGFEDPDAAPFFLAAGWAEESADEPLVVITIGELDIDPATVFGGGSSKGQHVIGQEG